MFEVADVVAITKTDVKDIFDFSFEKAKANVRKRNENAEVFVLSAKKDENVDALEQYLRKRIDSIKNA